MDKILHHFERMGNHCLLVFTGESSFQAFLGASPVITLQPHVAEPCCAQVYDNPFASMGNRSMRNFAKRPDLKIWRQIATSLRGGLQNSELQLCEEPPF